MRSIFGWSYPPGCSGPPEDNEPVILRCSKGHFLPVKPIRSEPWKAATACPGTKVEVGYDELVCGGILPHEPHEVVWDNGQYDFYYCKRCKQEVKV